MRSPLGASADDVVERLGVMLGELLDRYFAHPVDLQGLAADVADFLEGNPVPRADFAGAAGVVGGNGRFVQSNGET